MKQLSAEEASLAGQARPIATAVVNTQAALPAEAPNSEPSEAASDSPATPTAAPEAPSAQAVQTVAAATTTRNVPQNTVASVKSSPHARTEARDEPSATAEAAVEKSNGLDNPVSGRTAPAAPDTAFDPDAARNALTNAAAHASSCRQKGDPSGTANLTITFAPSGRVTSAQIQGPPFSGTATGGCIASTMRRATVPAFSGDYITVSKTIVVQ